MKTPKDYQLSCKCCGRFLKAKKSRDERIGPGCKKRMEKIKAKHRLLSEFEVE